MKKIYTLLMALTFASFSFAQDFPIDFESGSYSFVDFDGGAVTVIANPQSSGINTSANVAQMIKSAGLDWAGSKLALESAIDFTTNQVFTMKVFSPRVGVPVLFKLEGETYAIATEKSVNTTVANQWETLTFDFSGSTSGIYTNVVFIFDMGTAGDGSANFTFLFDDIEFSPSPVVLPTLPIYFETGDFSFVDFDGGAATVIANPQSSGSNTSATVAQIIRNGGAVYGGSKLLLNSKIDFSSAATITMKVFSARAGVPVLLKLEGDAQTEVLVNTTVANEWETLEWDFTGKPSDTYNFLVFMFDFGTVGDGSANSTFLFDDIQQIDATGGLSQIDLPVDFESETVNYAMADFGGNAYSLVEDPENAANTVVKVVKTAGAATWAGTTIGTALGFATYIPISLTDSKMTVRVWSPDANTPIRLKIEDANDETHTCETQTNTTVASGWETITFDFASQATGTESLSVGLGHGWVYNKASIFFNFDIEGTDKVYYFDDVKMYEETTGFDELDQFDFHVYPNPASDYLYISNTANLKRIEIYSITGQKVKTVETFDKKIQVSELPQGVYILTVERNSGEIFSSKFFKN